MSSTSRAPKVMRRLVLPILHSTCAGSVDRDRTGTRRSMSWPREHREHDNDGRVAHRSVRSCQNVPNCVRSYSSRLDLGYDRCGTPVPPSMSAVVSHRDGRITPGAEVDGAGGHALALPARRVPMEVVQNAHRGTGDLPGQAGSTRRPDHSRHRSHPLGRSCALSLELAAPRSHTGSTVVHVVDHLSKKMMDGYRRGP